MGLEAWPWPLAAAVSLLFQTFFGALGNMPLSSGEELGWRGFLAPRLRTRLSFTATALLVRLIWSAWHYPLIFLNRPPSYPVPMAVELLNFTVGLTSATVIFNRATERSGSVWPAVLQHSAHNCGMGVLERMIRKTDNALRVHRLRRKFGGGSGGSQGLCGSY